MPRRDGFDTNQELLADFNRLGYDVFTTLWTKQVEEGVPEWLQGKPLDALSVTVRDATPPGLQEIAEQARTDAIVSERLSVRPLVSGDVDNMRDHLTMRHYPEDVYGHYETIASSIGQVILGNSTEVKRVLPPEGVIAEYGAQLLNGRKPHIETLKERPTKRSIILGKLFGERALEYAQSDWSSANASEESSLEQLADVMSRLKLVSHRFDIAMQPGLPLNGYEPKHWLQRYAEVMAIKREGLERRLRTFEKLGAAEGSPTGMLGSMHNDMRDMLPVVTDSLARAKQLLADK
jgi:hypothetical protein